MPNQLGPRRHLPGGQVTGQNRKRTPRDGNAAQPGHQHPAAGRPRQHRRRQPPPRPRPAAHTKAASGCMNTTLPGPWPLRELEEVPMPIVGGLDIHRKQITFDYLDTGTGQVQRGQISPADREHLRGWLARFTGSDDVAFAVEGCTGWRYVVEELAAAGVAAHLAEPADTAFARGRKRHAKTDKTDSRHLRQLLAEGRLPECWIPPGRILECRALLETYHDLRCGQSRPAACHRPGSCRSPPPWR